MECVLENKNVNFSATVFHLEINETVSLYFTGNTHTHTHSSIIAYNRRTIKTSSQPVQSVQPVRIFTDCAHLAQKQHAHALFMVTEMQLKLNQLFNCVLFFLSIETAVA